MLCHCGAATRVTDTRRSADGRTLTRDRICKGPGGHPFTTRERAQVSLDQVLVRRSGDEALVEFDRERIVTDLADGVLGVLSAESVRRVVEDAVETLSNRLSDVGHSLTSEEMRQHGKGRRFAIYDRDIGQAISRRLRDRRPEDTEPMRLAQVLYVMSTEGRGDRPGRQGWRTAEDVLRWMDLPENYPDQATPGVRRPPVPTDDWWPHAVPPNPEQVIKSSGGQHPFKRWQLEKSIALALLGRPDATEASVRVADWVLWGLAGQSIVLSSQLKCAVLECLRRVDDIAYLRWVTIAKSFTSTKQFRPEALALVLRPSARLVFDVDAGPRRGLWYPSVEAAGIDGPEE